MDYRNFHDHEAKLHDALLGWIQVLNRLARLDGDGQQRKRHLKRHRQAAEGALSGVQVLLRYGAIRDYDSVLADAVANWDGRVRRAQEILADDWDGFMGFEYQAFEAAAVQPSQVPVLCRRVTAARGAPQFRTLADLGAFLGARQEALFRGERDALVRNVKYLPQGLAIVARNGKSLFDPGTNTGTARDYAEASVVCGISVLLSA